MTFVFDCILAYAIAKKIYDINVMTSWGEVDPFNLSLAFTNHDVWAVIFCGFVVYIIWGIVFDMTMTAYEDLKTNKTEIGNIDCRLDHYKQLLADKHVELNNYEGLINKLIIERKGLNASLSSKATFDPNIIKRSFSEFFQGWTTVLGALLLPDEESKSVYEQEVNAFISIP